jgi:hypothetical protein
MLKLFWLKSPVFELITHLEDQGLGQRKSVGSRPIAKHRAGHLVGQRHHHELWRSKSAEKESA